MKSFIKIKSRPTLINLKFTRRWWRISFKAGQFIVLRPLETSERIPLTIMKADKYRRHHHIGGQSDRPIHAAACALNEGDQICDLLGPLGHPSEIEKFGTVMVVGGGVGTAVSYAVAAALKDAGNRIISIIGARDKDFMILEDDFREYLG